MGFLDRFLGAIKLNDDFDDEDEDDLLDDEDPDDEDFDEEDEPPARTKSRFFRRFEPDDEETDDFAEDKAPVRKPVPPRQNPTARTVREARPIRRDDRKQPKSRSKVTPIRRKNSEPQMDVNVLRPSSMEDTREIADALMDGSTVVLNLEGMDVDIAQRVIDFTCGVCYSLHGNLQKVSGFIFILTPENVDISGDYQSIIDGAFDLPSMKAGY